MTTTTNRGYYRVAAGVPPRETDINEGFIDKVDSDVQAEVDGRTALTAELTALDTRVDAVITDQGASSQLRRWPEEFRPFSVGSAAYALGNTPVYLSGATFRVSGNWVGEFTPGRALRISWPTNAWAIVWVKSRTYLPSGTVVTVTSYDSSGNPFSVPAQISDVALSAIQYGMPQVQGYQIEDGTLSPAKLADPPALAADLAAAEATLSAQLDGIETQAGEIETNLTAHTGKSSGIHGIADGETLETVTGALAKISTHDADVGAHPDVVADLQSLSEKGVAGGYAGLDGPGANAGKIPLAQLPPLGLKGVTRGFTTMSDIGAVSQTVDSATFTAVDPAKSFIVFTVRGTATTVAPFGVTAEFGPSNNLVRLRRENANGLVTVAWQVVEFH